jgi:hypothetical protein
MGGEWGILLTFIVSILVTTFKIFTWCWRTSEQNVLQAAKVQAHHDIMSRGTGAIPASAKMLRDIEVVERDQQKREPFPWFFVVFTILTSFQDDANVFSFMLLTFFALYYGRADLLLPASIPHTFNKMQEMKRNFVNAIPFHYDRAVVAPAERLGSQFLADATQKVEAARAAPAADSVHAKNESKLTFIPCEAGKLYGPDVSSELARVKERITEIEGEIEAMEKEERYFECEAFHARPAKREKSWIEKETQTESTVPVYPVTKETQTEPMVPVYPATKETQTEELADLLHPVQQPVDVEILETDKPKSMVRRIIKCLASCFVNESVGQLDLSLVLRRVQNHLTQLDDLANEVEDTTDLIRFMMTHRKGEQEWLINTYEAYYNNHYANESRLGVPEAKGFSYPDYDGTDDRDDGYDNARPSDFRKRKDAGLKPVMNEPTYEKDRQYLLSKGVDLWAYMNESIKKAVEESLGKGTITTSPSKEKLMVRKPTPRTVVAKGGPEAHTQAQPECVTATSVITKNSIDIYNVYIGVKKEFSGKCIRGHQGFLVLQHVLTPNADADLNETIVTFEHTRKKSLVETIILKKSYNYRYAVKFPNDALIVVTISSGSFPLTKLKVYDTAGLKPGYNLVVNNGEEVSPGTFINHDGDFLIYDASTVGGWSGSPIIVGSKLLGIHVKGLKEQGQNYGLRVENFAEHFLPITGTATNAVVPSNL